MASSTIRHPARSARPIEHDAPESNPQAGDPHGPEAPGPGSASVSSSRRRRPGRNDGRVLRTGIAISILAHLLLIAVARYVVLFDDPGVAPALDVEPAPRPPGTPVMEVVSLRAVTDAARERAPAESPTSSSSVRTPGPPIFDAPIPEPDPVARPTPPGARAPTATPARDRFAESLEALRPRLLDPRLRPGDASALRTDDERAAIRAYARIHALNDSILAAMENERRATDWTWTDEQGRRWGMSPGKLHLGGVEIPLPLTFSPTAAQREWYREWSEIQAQAEQGAIDEDFADRVEAIRRQRDAERNTP